MVNLVTVKLLALSKEAVADYETWKNMYKQFDHRHLDNDLSIWKNFVYLRRQKEKYLPSKNKIC